jgi:acetyl esterase/lipase
MLCLAGLLLVVSGCTSVVERVGTTLFYWKAKLPDSQIQRDIPYRAGSTLPKHQLDLFLPTGTNWPVLIFIHGGGWTKGDKSLVVGGADVYQNIGRFYAAHGIGVAVINYRLQPGVDWRTQLDDAAAATAWVHANIGTLGGNPRRLFVSGHSAGGQLADRIALDPEPLKKYGLSPADICGVISVSGAGLDLADEKTYELGASRSKYEDLFGSKDTDWKKEASPVTYARPGAPPFLIMYAGGEKQPLQRQAQRLSEVLTTNSIENKVVVVPGQSHELIVLCLSRPDKTAGPAILNFIRTTKSR